MYFFSEYIKKELKEKKEQKVKKEKIVKKEKKVKEEIPFVNLVSFGTDQLELKDQKIGTIAWTKEPDQQIWPGKNCYLNENLKIQKTIFKIKCFFHN